MEVSKHEERIGIKLDEEESEEPLSDKLPSFQVAKEGKYKRSNSTTTLVINMKVSSHFFLGVFFEK
jgi:hypothetical protein